MLSEGGIFFKSKEGVDNFKGIFILTVKTTHPDGKITISPRHEVMANGRKEAESKIIEKFLEMDHPLMGRYSFRVTDVDICHEGV